MNEQQKQRALLIDKELQAINLTNKFLRAGILAVVSKETNFDLVTENSYRNTPNDRIIRVFGAERFRGYDIATLKKNDVDFFNVVYNRKDLGNGPYDGYKYRGRGFNGITGRVNYANVGKGIGLDLIADPDLLNNPVNAAKAIAFFFRDSILAGQRLGLFFLRYGIVTTGQIGTIEKGATIAHQANMGWKKTPAQDPTGGYAVTLKNAPGFLELIS